MPPAPKPGGKQSSKGGRFTKRNRWIFVTVSGFSALFLFVLKSCFVFFFWWEGGEGIGSRFLGQFPFEVPHFSFVVRSLVGPAHGRVPAFTTAAINLATGQFALFSPFYLGSRPLQFPE